QRDQAIVGVLDIRKLDVEAMALPRFLRIRDVDDRVAGPGRGCDVDRAVELAVSSCPGRAAAHGEQQPEQRRKDKAGWTMRATEHFGPPPEAWAHSRRAPPAAPAGQRAAHPTE